MLRSPRVPARPMLAARSPPWSEAWVHDCASHLPKHTPLSTRSLPRAGGWQRAPRRWAGAGSSSPAAYLAGSRGNLKKARSDCVLFRVQLGAAQKFGIVACPPAGPALPSPPPQGSPPARRGRGGEPGRPAGSAGPARRGEGRAGEKPRGAGGAPRSEAELGTRLHSAVSGREDLPPPPLVHLPPARDATASFPQCTLAPAGALSSLSFLPPPLSFRRLLCGRACARKHACPGVARWRRDLARAATVRLRRLRLRWEGIAHAGVSPGILKHASIRRLVGFVVRGFLQIWGKPACYITSASLFACLRCHHLGLLQKSS